MDTLINLRNTVQSAASVVAAVSTITGTGHSSDFGDCFSKQHNEPMLRWMAKNTVYENEDDRETVVGAENQPRNPNEAPGEDLAGSDSDDDLDLELFHARIARGKEKLEANDSIGAEIIFRNCLLQIPNLNLELRRPLKLLVMDGLARAFTLQEKPDDVRSILVEKITLHPRDSQNGRIEALGDTFTLANVLVVQKAYPEAMLYGRKALKDYRRLNGPAEKPGVEKLLKLLIRTCREYDNPDEVYAFGTLLEKSRSRNDGTPPTMAQDPVPKETPAINVETEELPPIIFQTTDITTG